jgi:hypothetical protein
MSLTIRMRDIIFVMKNEFNIQIQDNEHLHKTKIITNEYEKYFIHIVERKVRSSYDE